MDKIKDQELKKLHEFELFFEKANKMLGKLTSEFEFKKSDILRQMSEKFIEREDFKEGLSKIYGEDISVNLDNGNIIRTEEK